VAIILLRIDVDNAYVAYERNKLKRFFKLVLNYLNENYWVPHLKILGYNECFYKFMDLILELGINASIFFKTITLPNDENTVKTLIDKNYDLGLHLLSATTYDEFIKELNVVEKVLRTKVVGFSKHGGGRRKLSRKHAWEYKVNEYLRWGIKAGLLYFSGNVPSITTKIIKISGTSEFFYLPTAFYIEPWLRRPGDKLDDVLANEGCSVVVVHPSNFCTHDIVRKEFNRLLDKADIITSIKDYLLRINGEIDSC